MPFSLLSSPSSSSATSWQKMLFRMQRQFPARRPSRGGLRPEEEEEKRAVMVCFPSLFAKKVGGREEKGAFRKSRRNWKDHKRFPGQGGKEGGDTKLHLLPCLFQTFLPSSLARRRSPPLCPPPQEKELEKGARESEFRNGGEGRMCLEE